MVVWPSNVTTRAILKRASPRPTESATAPAASSNPQAMVAT
ncbi:MAG: hypothetical protein ACLQIB_51100 [Isosphaeraceae bacterium]